MMEIRVSIYFDTSHEIRGLVSVFRDGQNVQTVGSAIVGSDELNIMIRSAMFTLNAVKQNG